MQRIIMSRRLWWAWFFGAVLATSGCKVVPAKVADGVKILDENTHKLAAHYRARLAAIKPADDEDAVNIAHDLSLLDANEALSTETNTWAQNNRKGS